MVRLDAGKAKKLDAYLKKCRSALEGKGWSDGLSYAADNFLESVWGPMFDYDFRYLQCGCPLDGRREVGYVQYFSYLRRDRKPIVFEVLNHYAARLNLSLEEYELFSEQSEALDSLGYMTVRITDIELDYARKYVSERVVCAISLSNRWEAEREWAM
ncbi:hypothetical protein [Paenibacillus sp.]|uniref:hypothetical protein n=1 Tax=Paenibacillus sp. TaxID=58172 RepID=UPI0028113D21|nr:hypothetical protein [Paenibacillus sp.]